MLHLQQIYGAVNVLQPAILKELCDTRYALPSAASQQQEIGRFAESCHIHDLVIFFIVELNLDYMLPPHSYSLILLQFVGLVHLLRYLLNRTGPLTLLINLQQDAKWRLLARSPKAQADGAGATIAM